MTTVRVEQGISCDLQAHLQRLEHDSHVLRQQAPSCDAQAIQQWVRQHSRAPLERLRITLQQGQLHLQLHPYYLLKRPLSMSCRHHVALPYPHFKSLYTLQRHKILQEAQAWGFTDGISITQEGYLLEAAFGNIFWIDQGTLFLPDPILPYYLGQTLKGVLSQSPWPICYTTATLEHISSTARIFRSNALSSVLPILRIEARVWEEDLELSTYLKNLR